jgi:ABC-2 type transport system permease protein
MKLLAQEWKKLIGSGQTLALFVTVVVVGIVLTFFDGVQILGEPANALDAGIVNGLYTGTKYLAWIFPPILGVLMVTTEFRLGTAISTFLLTPNRPRVLVAKMLVGGLGGALVGLLSMLSAYATAAVIVSTAPVSVDPDQEQLLGSVLGMVTTGFAMAMLGVALGALIRAQLASLAVLLGWLLFVEGIIVGVIGQAGIALPGQLVMYSVTAPGDGTWFTQVIQGNITAFVGFVGIIGWAALVGTIAAVTTLRKDID